MKWRLNRQRGFDKKFAKLLDDKGFGDATVQNFGSSRDILIRLAPRKADDGESDGREIDAKMIGNTIMEALIEMDSSATMRRIEFVGAKQLVKNYGSRVV